MTIYDVSNGYMLTKVGPQNVTRMEGHSIHIPCSFYALDSFPVWEINGYLYNVISIPKEYRFYRYGLYIHSLKTEMNGTTFRCHYSTGYGLQSEASAIGILTVLTKDYNTR